MQSRQELLTDHRPPTPIAAAEVAGRRRDSRQLVVLDDDPTGTQSVADLPVLNSWSKEDVAWALGTGAPAVYVMTNSRSLPEAEAANRNREVVEASLQAADELGCEVDFVSRSDSTLRGHYPLEPDAITAVLTTRGEAIDGVILVPAFGEAGRITVDGIHYAGNDRDGYAPVGDSEFARDATFGYASSDLRDWVAEKSGGRIPRNEVGLIRLDDLRGDRDAVVAQLLGGAEVIAVDIVEETDLRALALSLAEAETKGKRFVFRVGPPFVRAMIGQDVRPPLDGDRLAETLPPDAEIGGLIVVGSHVALTTRQLEYLVADQQPHEVEVDVEQVLGADKGTYLSGVADDVVEHLRSGNVVLRTSRELVRGRDGDDSLRIARSVSDAVVQVVRRTLAAARPRFVIAKGGITSSDVAAHGLQIGRAVVRGPMLPGIVSLWEPIDGPAVGIPYIVFAGNVGDDSSLAVVARKLTHPSLNEEYPS